MAFALKWLAEARDEYERLREAALPASQARGGKSTKQLGLFKQVHKCLELLANNPRHPGLNTHEFHSLPHPYDPKQKVFEAYAQNRTPGAYRVFWCYGPGRGDITVVAITAHP